MAWDFGKSRGYIGLTGAATTIFEGDALAGTVREIIQNSLDAGTGNRVSIGISLKSHSVSAMPGVQTSAAPLRLAYSTWLERQAKSENDFEAVPSEDLDAVALFYRDAIDLVESKEITVLGFHDWGTSGLTGPVREKKGVTPGPYVALVHNSGDNHKTTGTSLGSFGQGSKAPIALSQLRTVFYLTRVDGDGVREDRFIGKALWSSAYTADDVETFTTETGFYSADDETLHPFTGADIPEWATSTRQALTEETGTSVYIPCPNGLESSEDYEDKIFTTVLLNFYYAIENGHLEIAFPDGRKIDSSNLRSLTKESRILERNDLDEDKFRALQTLFFAADDYRGFGDSSKFGRYYFAIRVDDSIQGKAVSLARSPGMFITSDPPLLHNFPGMKNFNLFVCVIGQRGLTVLRAAEPPTHDRLEFSRINSKDKRKRDAYENDYEDFAKEIRALARRFAELETSSVFEVRGLADLLGGVSEDDETEARIEFPTKLTLTQGKKRSRRESVGAGAGIPGPSGSGGSGGRGSGGITGAGNADGGRSGTRGAKLKQTTELLLEVEPKSGLHSVYFTVEKPADAMSICLFESGENQREPLRFSTIEDGPLVGQVEQVAWEKIGTGKHRFKVSFYPETAINSVEAWLQPRAEGTG